MKPVALSDTFPRTTLHTEAGPRTAVRLTSGPGFAYPLYYFIPSITDDGRYMIFHREHDGEIQLHRLDLSTGETAQMTHGTCPDAGWKPWGVDPARGVLGDRSALDAKNGRVVCFDGRRAECIDVKTLERRSLFTLPKGRFALSQNCVTTDGAWFCWVHADRAAFDAWLERDVPDGVNRRRFGWMVEGAELCAAHLDTGEQRTLLVLDYPVHHVLAYDERRLVCTHAPGEMIGMFITDVDGGGYTVPRPRDAAGGRVCHKVATERGIAYEVVLRDDGRVLGGILDPDSTGRYEFDLPGGVNHVGCDPAGKLFFYQQSRVGGSGLTALLRHDPDGADEWLDLTGVVPVYGRGQKTHLHPRMTPDRRWIQMVAGDPETETNRILLVDVSDLDATVGMPDATALRAMRSTPERG